MADNFVQPAIPRFDDHYDHWSMLMENFLRSKKYWQVVSEGVTEPSIGAVVTDGQRVELEAQRLKDLKWPLLWIHSFNFNFDNHLRLAQVAIGGCTKCSKL
uniref:Uncharacterized protein n=1 Tax=Cannabis sativa TaxID=3483 RepID=A0A803NT18_CANSA